MMRSLTLRCHICGRVLLRAAATGQTIWGEGPAGPGCARKTGLLPPRKQRPQLLPRMRKPRSGAQMEMSL